MIRLKTGIVSRIIYDGEDIQELLVDTEDKNSLAVNYTLLTGKVREGDTVILNTTATFLGLGTGGYDFVVADVSRNEVDEPAGPGHIMKLRYTPLQHSVLSVEEEKSPCREAIMNFNDLAGTYAIICPLHSMMAVTAVALKYLSNVKIAYIMTDGGSLPLSFSKTVRELKEKEIIGGTITVGQAFGGDYEAVNIYTGLIAAKEVCKADVILVSMGPGITGTGTKYGFSGVDDGHIIDAVYGFKGNPVYVPRISFSDSRERHRGISHHSMTILKELCHSPCDIVFPEMDKSFLELIKGQIDEIRSMSKYNIHVEDGGFIIDAMNHFGVNIETMGRVYDDDPYFYEICAASAKYVADNIRK
ncbi:MAG: DUF3866 family protein [Thermoanaerobacteraceae bacterium]|nr:DUF3866 family protein [Thermoanaerobacteraceae bacterium]